MPSTEKTNATIQDKLELYSEDHRNPTNKKIHFICVPLILLSLLGALRVFQAPTMPFLLNGSMGALLFAFFYYLRFGFPVAAKMMMLYVPFYFLVTFVQIYLGTMFLLKASLAIFSICWVFQFIGHAIEGRRPSFSRDVSMLLIGPAWCLRPIF